MREMIRLGSTELIGAAAAAAVVVGDVDSEVDAVEPVDDAGSGIGGTWKATRDPL